MRCRAPGSRLWARVAQNPGVLQRLSCCQAPAGIHRQHAALHTQVWSQVRQLLLLTHCNQDAGGHQVQHSAVWPSAVGAAGGECKL